MWGCPEQRVTRYGGPVSYSSELTPASFTKGPDGGVGWGFPGAVAEDAVNRET